LITGASGAEGTETIVDENEDAAGLEHMERILREETVGYVSMSHEGEPYAVPVNYWYDAGRVLFHCGFGGKKMEFLKANPRVCFVVGRQVGEVREHSDATACHVDNDSVICYGSASTLDDLGRRAAALNAFNRRFNPGADEISRERAEKCNVVEIEVSEMTGRTERDGKHVHWRHGFTR
jgi:uncharacterized protein